jgi:glucose-6-phosphate 1-dehydrogenase
VQNIGSLSETFVSLKLKSVDPRWKDVALSLTTGKAMDRKVTEVRIRFRKFHEAQSNCLVFRIQPNEGVEIELFAKKPGYEREFETRKLAFNYPEDTTLPDAYEQVIVDAIRARKSLFTSSEEVIASWQLLQPLLSAWEMDARPLTTYPKGSSTHNICSV